MSLAWPWLLLALPLPWLACRLWPPGADGGALRVADLASFAPLAAPRGAHARVRLASLAWVLLVLAAARPQGWGELETGAASGRDLMLAVDLSTSMATRDLAFDGAPLDRLAAVKRLADDFLARREGDRVGLVVFGRHAYLHTPLTWDIAALRAAVAGLETGLAGPDTALGDALALAAVRLDEWAGTDRVLVLLTDGAQTAGELTARQGAWLAQRAAVRIHAVAIGAANDEAAEGAPDEASLREIAATSGGRFVRATDGAALAAFYRAVDAMERRPQGSVVLRPAHELYPWPLACALVLALWLALRRPGDAW